MVISREIRNWQQPVSEKAGKDIPVYEEVVNSVWRKEPELRKLKEELSGLDRRIKANLNEKTKPENSKVSSLAV